ncbi:hypothetical protein [Streptomyces sp. NPDC127039]|uniref:hypothetical protein n=1 Tax=Streptomyces sp. NPDC127039 TaxID=3347115 RepID=UPI00364F0387
MTDVSGRRRSLTAVLTTAACLLFSGCGTEAETPEAPSSATASPPSTAPSATSVDGKPVSVLDIGRVKGVLPDEAALPGWSRIVEPLVTTDQFICQGVMAHGCPGLVAMGQSDFKRGGRTPAESIRLTFALYSCSSESAAHDLYASLNLSGAQVGLSESLGDEQTATRDVLKSSADVQPTLLSVKARSGTTMLWVTAMTSEQKTTKERTQAALRLLRDRVQQAKEGIKPNVGARIG